LIRDSLMRGFNGYVPYSLPKGRRKRHKRLEKPHETAIREFGEETGISSALIKLLSKESFDIRYNDDGDEYVFKIFFATIPRDTVGHIDQNNIDQKIEVSEIIWLSKEEFAQRNPTPLCCRVYLDNFDRILLEYNLVKIGLNPGKELKIPDQIPRTRQKQYSYFISKECQKAFANLPRLNIVRPTRTDTKQTRSVISKSWRTK